MSDHDREEIRELSHRAGTQGKHALKNAGRATVATGEAALEEGAELASDAVEATRRVAPRISTRGLAAISSDTGIGFLATAVALYAGAVAYNKFGAAFSGRGRAVK